MILTFTGCTVVHNVYELICLNNLKKKNNNQLSIPVS